LGQFGVIAAAAGFFCAAGPLAFRFGVAFMVTSAKPIACACVGAIAARSTGSGTE
jgi:hypothetical protein